MKNNSLDMSSLASFEFSCWKEDNFVEHECAKNFVAERVTPQASPDMVGHVALARYSQLLKCGRGTLKGMFSADELRLVLHAHPQPWWSENLWGEIAWNVADAIYSNYMDGVEVTPEVDGLFQKIQSLNPMQRLALVDVLECAWRSNDPVDFAHKALE